METLLDTLSRAGVFSSKVSEYTQRYETLSDSKSVYEQAEKSMSSSANAPPAAPPPPRAAADAQVAKEDANYDAAQKKSAEAKEKLLAQVKEMADQYMQQNDYSKALMALTALKSVSDDMYKSELQSCAKKYVDYAISQADAAFQKGNDTSAAMVKLDSCAINLQFNGIQSDESLEQKKEFYEGKAGESAVAAAKALEQKGDYPAALNTLAAANNKYPSAALTEAIQSCKQDYVAYAETKADEALKSGDYQSAVSIAAVCSGIVGDVGDIADKVEYYKSFAPVALVDMETFYEDGDIGAYIDNEITDNLGKNYTGYMYGEWTHTIASAVYKVNGLYGIFSGRVIVKLEQKNVEDVGAFRIYGDGKLLFDTGEMGKGSVPVDFNVSVAGVGELKIEFKAESKTPFLVNAYLQKSIPQ